MSTKIQSLLLQFSFASLFSMAGLMIPQDFCTHLEVSALFSAGSHQYFEKYQHINRAERIVLSTAWALVPGFAKELTDGASGNNRFSASDLAADFTGALSGSLFTALIGKPAYIAVSGDPEGSVSIVFGFSP